MHSSSSIYVSSSISDEEYNSRHSALRGIMEKLNLDGLILHSQESIYWTTGYNSTAFFPYTCCVVPREGKPILLIWSVEKKSAETSVCSALIKTYDNDTEALSVMRLTLDKVADQQGRLGVEKSSWYLSACRFESMVEAFPERQFEDISGPTGDLRSVKSSGEISFVTAAARIADGALGSALKATNIGKTERDVNAEMARTRILLGSDLPIDGGVTFGTRTRETHAPWADNSLSEGDLVKYEIHGIAQGYWARVTRSGIAGEPTQSQRDIFAIMRDALDSGIAEMRDGNHVSIVDQALRNPLIKVGIKYGKTFTRRLGYSIGLNYRPTPGDFRYDISPTSDFLLSEGMTMNIFVHAEGFALGDTVLITNSGGVCLTKTPRELLTFS